ncbi:MAG: glycoside hydrolase family 3 C-terminal domain-containing protein, partial [Bifidobacteriaceae bacterium]|nr:glycoside hydrolase family 3 C-terminal domain-containing protein [Bifidobacteriaceae bacterium]
MKKRLAALVALTFIGAVLVPSTANAVLYPGTIGLAQRASTEGIVMLKNTDQVLPLDPSRTVSVFGRVQINYFPVGYGSGGDVKYTYTTNLLTGLRRNPGITVNESLAKVYEDWCASHRPDDGGWGEWPLSHPEMPLTAELVSQAAASSDTAVVVIGRAAGEAREAMLAKGSFYLTDAERAMLSKVNAAFDKVVVLLNVGNIIDMQWTADYPNIRSLLYVWQGGQESGTAIASVLSGDVSPSGKLPDTIAYTYDDYPTVGNFGHNDIATYQEDIYVGYRYFETFARDRVAYPFGFGLSYTTFDIATDSVTEGSGNINVKTTVTNTGQRPGKEVVQVYHGAPQGLLGKPAKTLAAYAKTTTLAPGASETLTLSFPVTALASFDDAGKTGNPSSWVMEAGDYPIYVGNSVRDAAQRGAHPQPALRVTETVTSTLAPQTPFNRWHASADAQGNPVLAKDDPVPVTTPAAVKARIDAYVQALPNLTQPAVDQGIKLIDVYEDPSLMGQFLDQLSLEELAYLTSGAGTMDPPYSVLGSAGVYGGYTEALQHYGILPLTLTDGPSGIRIAESATQLPIGTLLASTFNDQLVEDLYAAVGAEMVLNGSSAILAPGMNLHRDPLCGRNFEYFSEDPLLAGQMGAAFTRGVQSQGVGATPKHFAANNQETGRGGNDSQVSERALREIYLKAFEITVKAGQPLNIMTSYNRINSQYNNMNWQLVTAILRDEWGFDGVVMTDWGGVSGADASGLEGEAGRVRSGVDVVEQGSGYPSMDWEIFPGFIWHIAGLEDIVKSITGELAPPAGVLPLKLAELRRSAERLMNIELKSERFRTAHHLPLHSYSTGEYEPAYRPYQVVQPAYSRATADAVYVAGKKLAGFTPNNLDYSVFTTDWSDLPQVTASAGATQTIAVTQATPQRPIATVLVRDAGGDEVRYRIVFTDAASRPVFHPADISADLAAIEVNGTPLPNFYRATYDYTVWVDNSATTAITASAPAGVTYAISRAGDLVTIRTESATQAREYRVLLGDIDASKAPESDDFSAADLDASTWTVGAQTANLTKVANAVRIVSEPSEWLNTDAADLKNYVSQPAQGNWEATVHVGYDKLPVGPGAGLGIAVFDSLDSYVRLDLEGYEAVSADTTAAASTRFHVRNLQSGSPNSNTTSAVNAVTLDWFTGQPVFMNPMDNLDSSFDLRITKAGESYTFAFKTATGGWTGIGGTQTANLTNPRLALFATHIPGTAEPITATFGPVEVANVTPPAFPTAVTTPLFATGTAIMHTDTGFSQRGGYAAPAPADPETAGHQVFSGGEFNNSVYNVNAPQAGFYSVVPRVTSTVGTNSKWTFFVQVDGEDWESWGQIGGTPGWTDLAPKVTYLSPGLHKIRVHCWTTTGFSLSALKFTRSTANRDPLFAAIATAKSISPAPYTAASFAALGTALESAQAVLTSGASVQANLTAAATALNAAIDALVAKPPSTPAPVYPPAVSFAGGQPQVGAQASGTVGAWTATPDEVAFEWLRNGQPIPGATAQAYAVTADDAAAKLSLRVTVKVAGQEDGVFTTPPVEVVAAPAPVATVAPAFSGQPAVG